MKRFLVAFGAFLLVLFVIAPAFAVQDSRQDQSTILSVRQTKEDTTQEAKAGEAQVCNISNSLACGLVLNIGKPVMYVPNIDEGCIVFFTGKFDFVRDAEGNILVHLDIKRPLINGGNFQKDFVPWTTGRLGSARPLDPKDTRGIL